MSSYVYLGPAAAGLLGLLYFVPMVHDLCPVTLVTQSQSALLGLLYFVPVAHVFCMFIVVTQTQSDLLGLLYYFIHAPCSLSGHLGHAVAGRTFGFVVFLSLYLVDGYSDRLALYWSVRVMFRQVSFIYCLGT